MKKEQRTHPWVAVPLVGIVQPSINSLPSAHPNRVGTQLYVRAPLVERHGPLLYDAAYIVIAYIYLGAENGAAHFKLPLIAQPLMLKLQRPPLRPNPLTQCGDLPLVSPPMVTRKNETLMRR